jgi:hypothetical protein
MKRIRRNCRDLILPPFFRRVAKLPQWPPGAEGLRNRRAVRHIVARPPGRDAAMTRKPLLFAALLLGLVSAAYAQRGQHRDQRRQERPALFEALVRCRAVAEAAARLQCFDDAAAALAQAAERRDIVVVDRAQVRESRRRLFGLALPRLPIFGGGGDGRADEEEITTLEGTIARASQDGFGHWIVRLQDESLWVQTDNNALALRPRPGQPVVINRGALGSYIMRVNRQPGIRVRRQL